ncbi:MAG: DUF4923 family protein [Bacteroidales bacterium]|nr:DUF4923 family protein [Bacteroidales bacterium]
MKNILFVCLIIILTASCSKMDLARIEGSWREDHSKYPPEMTFDGSAIYTFADDGTFVIKVGSFLGHPESFVSGTYEYGEEGHRMLTLTFENGTLPGHTEKYKVTKITSKEMEWKKDCEDCDEKYCYEYFAREE